MDHPRTGSGRNQPYNQWFRSNIEKRIGYAFVRQYWDREIAALSTIEVLKAEISDPGAVRLDDQDRAVFQSVQAAGVKTLMQFLDRLITLKLGHSLALFEIGRTREGRSRLAKEASVPEEALLDLVKRADLARLRLMGGGMIRQSWALGYKGLAALKKANPEEYFARCQAYYSRKYKGKPFDLTPQVTNSHLERMKQAVNILED